MTKRLIPLLAVFLGLAVSRAAEPPKTIKIGYQKWSSLSSLREHKFLDERLAPLGVKVEWVAFPAGPQLLEALSVNSAVFGETGNTPPIFAQASGAPIVYAAYKPSSAGLEGIVVPKGSPIKTLADLKGKKVAVTQGSSANWLLLKALESAGLSFKDIEPIYLPPPDALPAFLSGRVDAWAIWEPYKTVVQLKEGATQIVDAAALGIQDYGFYLARRDFAEEHPDLLKIITEELAKIEDFNSQNKRAHAEESAKEIRLPVEVLLAIGEKIKPGVLPLTPEVVAYQQQIADKFFELGLIGKKINVQDALLSK